MTSQNNFRTYVESDVFQKKNMWEMYQEPVPKFSDTNIISDKPLELFNMTKDETDYLWYTTR